jgi:hypothetical protein
MGFLLAEVEKERDSDDQARPIQSREHERKSKDLLRN